MNYFDIEEDKDTKLTFEDIKGKYIQYRGTTSYKIIENNYYGSFNFFTIMNPEGLIFSHNKKYDLVDDLGDNNIVKDYIRQNYL